MTRNSHSTTSQIKYFYLLPVLFLYSLNSAPDERARVVLLPITFHDYLRQPKYSPAHSCQRPCPRVRSTFTHAAAAHIDDPPVWTSWRLIKSNHRHALLTVAKPPTVPNWPKLMPSTATGRLGSLQLRPCLSISPPRSLIPRFFWLPKASIFSLVLGNQVCRMKRSGEIHRDCTLYSSYGQRLRLFMCLLRFLPYPVSVP